MNMAKKLYVGNLPFSATQEELRALFGQHGQVLGVTIVTDRETGQSRGFAFVEMDDKGAIDAIAALNETEMGGRTLRIDEAKPREDRGGGGRGGDRPRGGRSRY
jgi:RNA recognition motif-containing protein